MDELIVTINSTKNFSILRPLTSFENGIEFSKEMYRQEGNDVQIYYLFDFDRKRNEKLYDYFYM